MKKPLFKRLILTAAALLTLAALPLPALAKPPVILLDQDEQHIYIGQKTEILVDESKDLDIQEVSSKAFDDRFTPSDSDRPNFGYNDNAYWLRFTVKNTAPTSVNWLVLIANPHLDDVQLYSPLKNKWRLSETGDARPFHKREISHRHHVLPLTVAPGSSATFYLRCWSTSKLQVPVEIYSETALARSDRSGQIALGLNYGIILVMFLYNLFIFFSLRDRSYLYYVLFIGFYLLLQMFLNGVAYEFLWPELTWWNNRSGPFLAAFSMLWALQFTKSFLATRKNAPRLSRAITVVMFMLGAVMAVALLGDTRLAYRLSIGVPLVFVLVTLTTAVTIWRRGYRAARYFTAAWIVFLIGIVIYSLGAFAVIPHNFVTNYGMQIGASIEMVMLSFALADRINLIEKEKKEAQKELIRTQRESLEVQRRMANSFSRFVPVQFLKFLNKEDIVDIELGDSIEKEMTVLFSDIRSFTTLSESMTPQENINFLNSYLRRVSPIIRDNNGFIDKFIGDAIMALFDRCPDDAVQAGIDMLKELEVYNSHRSKSGYAPIRIGIGINTGQLMMGTIGDEERMEGTVIADAVNLASRLEGLTKVSRSNILIAENTFYQIENPSQFRSRIMGRVKVRGKKNKVSLFEIYNGDPDEIADGKDKTSADFEDAVINFFDGKVAEAGELFNKVAGINPADEAARAYADRCAEILERQRIKNTGS